MGLHKSQDIYWASIDGNVKRTGGASKLAMGQLAVVDLSKGPSIDGAFVVNDFGAVSKRSKLELRMGKPVIGVTKSLDNKSLTSIPFTLGDIIDVRVDAPSKEGIGHDDFVIGYNGAAGSELSFSNGDNEVFQLTLSGRAMEFLGYKDGTATAQFQMEAPNTGTKNTDWTDHEIVEQAIEKLKNYEFIGQVKLSDYVDIIPVNSDNGALTPNTQFYTLTIADKATFSDLSRVQAQYPALDVSQLSVQEDDTTYVAVAGSLPAAYSVGLADKLKGCATCPAGYTALSEGIVYQITIEDDGVDSSAAIEAAIPGVTVASVVRNIGIDGVGYYSAITDDVLTDAEIVTFKATSDLLGTATFEVISDNVVDLCRNTTTVDTVWIAGDNCTASTDRYTITLADDECGVNKLADLNVAFDNAVTVAFTALSTAITLTGTSGTANITVNGVNYLSTFNVSLTTTADDFVTAHAATILSASGWTVTANAGVLTFTKDTATDTAPSIANATTDLDGTVVTTPTNDAGSCQTTYEMTMTTNVVCDECDPIFQDIFSSSAPADFDLVPWAKAAKVYSVTAKMGIRFRSKSNILSGKEEYRDDLAFVADSVRLSLVGGFPDRINESYKLGTNGRFVVKLLDRFEPPINWGGNLRNFEDMSRMYFEGNSRHVGNNYAKFVFGEETRLDGTKQYVDYFITIEPSRTQGGVTQRVFEKRTYHIYAEVGRHENVETLLNDLALAAGIPTVQASAKT